VHLERRTRRQRRVLLRDEAVLSVNLQWFFPGAACADAAEHFTLGNAPHAARRRPPPSPTVTRPPPPASVITSTCRRRWRVQRRRSG
jgi:hypothetical protein